MDVLAQRVLAQSELVGVDIPAEPMRNEHRGNGADGGRHASQADVGNPDIPGEAHDVRPRVAWEHSETRRRELNRPWNENRPLAKIADLVLHVVARRNPVRDSAYREN